MSLVKKKENDGFTVIHPTTQDLQVENKISMSHHLKNSTTTDITTSSSSSSSKENPAACIFVASLNKGTDDDTLNKSVFNHFAQWGKLLGVKVLKDWLRRPYAFVQFENEQDSRRALQEAPGTFINGRSIRCEPARVNRSICLISFNQPFNKQFIQNNLSTFGELEDITIMQPYGKFHYVFIKFKYRDDAINAYLALKCSDYYNPNTWFVEWASNLDLNNLYGSHNTTAIRRCFDRCSIHVGNLPENISEGELRNQFQFYGKIFNAHLIRKPSFGGRNNARNNDNKRMRVFAFIKYYSEEDAARAIEQENGKLWNEKVIRVSYREFYHKPPAAVVSSPISYDDGGGGGDSTTTMTATAPHNYLYPNPFWGSSNNKKAFNKLMMQKGQKIMLPHHNTSSHEKEVPLQQDGGIYYYMSYCNHPAAAAAAAASTTTTTTIYDPSYGAYMMAANSGIIPSSKTSLLNNMSNMTTSTTTSVTPANAFYVYNSNKDNYLYSAITSAMVYYPYIQPYYYNNGMCYDTYPYHQKKSNSTHTKGTSPGQNGVTTA